MSTNTNTNTIHTIDGLKVEGYWYSNFKDNKNYPTPVPDIDYDSTEFLKALIAVETPLLKEWADFMAAYNENTKVPLELRVPDKWPTNIVAYRGYSCCRICGILNGTKEFQFNGWLWPEGYRHYIEVHKVRPSEGFEAFILGYIKSLRSKY